MEKRITTYLYGVYDLTNAINGLIAEMGFSVGQLPDFEIQILNTGNQNQYLIIVRKK